MNELKKFEKDLNRIFDPDRDLKDQILKDQKKRSALIKQFIKANKPDSLILWSLHDIDSKITNSLTKLHINLGGSSKTCLDK